jgi:hypothetical protein
MQEPNIFSLAKSELSQDAAIAYHLAWADRQFKTTHPNKHKLGIQLLKLLVGNRGKSLKLADETIGIGVQHDRIDIRVYIGCQAVLIIEDKTNTFEHGDQVNRYRGIAENWLDPEGKKWGIDRVIATYLKTGNEAIRATSDLADDVNKVFRRDLLGVLNQYTNTEDEILNQFRKYLQQWEDETNSYKLTPVNEKWSSRGVEGFYIDLERAFERQGLPQGNWVHVSNPARGFIAFYWNGVWIEKFKCNLYLQINDAKLLEIRVGDAHDEYDKPIKADARLRWGLLAHLQEVAKDDKYSKLKVEKSGRYKAGNTGGVAYVDNFLGTKNDGKIDLNITISNLRLAMDLLSEKAG